MGGTGSPARAVGTARNIMGIDPGRSRPMRGVAQTADGAATGGGPEWTTQMLREVRPQLVIDTAANAQSADRMRREFAAWLEIDVTGGIGALGGRLGRHLGEHAVLIQGRRLHDEHVVQGVLHDVTWHRSHELPLARAQSAVAYDDKVRRFRADRIEKRLRRVPRTSRCSMYLLVSLVRPVTDFSKAWRAVSAP